MNVLILGSGGREHTLAWKIRRSPKCDQLFIAPGNAGTRSVGTNVGLDILDFNAVSDFVVSENIDVVVVGPEKPLVMGIYDHLRHRHPDLIIVGPSKKGAQLEGSKSFAKKFMQDHRIPTADYIEVTQENIDEGIRHIQTTEGPYVLKADGLAGGKGVLIINDRNEAEAELNKMLSGKFGAAGHKVVIEEFLDGHEFSVFVLSNGKNYTVLPVAKDYKRIGEGDIGLNTGGMGAVSPVPFVDEAMMAKVTSRIIDPTIKGIQKDNLDYNGFIFLGLISVQGDPYVIEYNCRMGDPETQVVMPRLKTDLIDLFLAMREEKLDTIKLEKDPRAAVTVVCASGGYPESYNKGHVIHGLGAESSSIVFHAGTKEENNNIITSGGRVLAVTSYGNNKDEAVTASLERISRISFENMYYRRDIGYEL